MKATLLKDFADVNRNPHHKLYRLEPGGRFKVEHVIVSTSSVAAQAFGRFRPSDGSSGNETRIFACDAKGNGANYSDWLYDMDGLDHAAALRECGYEVG